jgi:phage-related protein
MPFTASESKPLVWLDIAEDALVILDIFSKKSGKTPMKVREACRDRLARYRKLTEED